MGRALNYQFSITRFKITLYPSKVDKMSAKYHVHQFIPLNPYNYLCEISIGVNVTTDERSDRNEF